MTDIDDCVSAALSDVTAPDVTLALTARDAQWVAAVLSVCGSLLSERASDGEVADNLNALQDLLDDHYSGDEANTLMHRARALLPLDTPLHFVDRDAAFAPRTPTQVS